MPMPMTNFSLTTAIDASVQAVPVPDVVNVPLAGHLPQIACGEKVVIGQRLAECLDPAVGDVHAPVCGEVTRVTFDVVSIKPDQGQDAAEAVSLSGLSGSALREALKRLGVDTAGLEAAKTLVINGLNPEPLVGVTEHLLQNNRASLEKGLAVAQGLTGAGSLVLVTGTGSKATLAGCAAAHAAPVYPNSCDPLAVKAATGKEYPEDVAVISVPALYAMGRVAESGLPLGEVILTVGQVHYQVKVGTPVGAVLAHAGIKTETGDRVVLGGPMRGRAAYSMAQGVAKDTTAVTVIPAKTFPRVTDSACLNCGECVLHCPARVMPNIIARYAEFRLFEGARKYGLDACFECGMCGFHCTTRRPLLQYIRLAKKELAAMDKAAASNAA